MPRVIVPVLPVSDGDASHVPNRNQLMLEQPCEIYLEKLAVGWMKERGEYQPGVQYILDRLPAGYTVWGKSRIKEPKHYDRWCYGHPDGKTFDSPNRFLPHFLHLMRNNGLSWGCPCNVCSPSTNKKAAPASATKPAASSTNPFGSMTPGTVVGASSAVQQPAPKRKPRQVDTSMLQVDDEGNPDVYRNLIDKLRRDGTVNEPIKETMSMDWRAERTTLPKTLNKMSRQPQWAPRPGEVVLFVQRLGPGEEICFEPSTKEFKIWSPKREFIGHPVWEAGVVTQTAVEGPVIEDLVVQTDKKFDLNYSGYRVEPLPDPNSDIKHISKQHKYLPLHLLRPFIFWGDFLHGIDEDKWHPAIRHALTAMSTFSLVEKFQFTGTWPAASISCRAMYLGPELILVGDTVRLLPRQSRSEVTDVLQITSIKLNLTNLDLASDNDYDKQHPYNSRVHIVGKAFTTEGKRPGARPAHKSQLPVILQGYGGKRWHRFHEPEQSLKVPFNRIIGRCYEEDAMILWFSTEDGSRQVGNPGQGLGGVLQGREFGSSVYRHIQDNQFWYWGDTRVESLDLATVNGQEVGNHDKSRDPKTWRKMIKVMEGNAALEDRIALKKAAQEARPLRRNSVVSSGWRAINVQERSQPEAMEVDTDDEEADQFINEVAGGVVDEDVDMAG